METFTIRVYGLLINEVNELLICDELIRGKYYTKFPGGGMEYGEGTRDCLAREFLEELNLKIDVGEHVYTTDYFQESAFGNAKQIISIYYYAIPLEPIRAAILPASHGPYNFEIKPLDNNEQLEAFRWINLSALTTDDVTLPIDKTLVKILIDKFNRPS